MNKHDVTIALLKWTMKLDGFIDAIYRGSVCISADTNVYCHFGNYITNS